MQNKFILLLIAACFVLIPTGTVVLAQDDEAAQIRQMFEERDREIKAILSNKETLTEQEREQLKQVINENIDFKAMGRAALGSFWETLTPGQQEEYLTTFTEIIRAQSLSNLSIYRAQVTYENIAVQGDSARVSIVATYDDVTTPVEYVLQQQDHGWKVVDIVLDGISTVESYARSFQTVIRKRGFETLMESLHEKLAEVQANA